MPVYALPEHQVVRALLPDIEDRRLSVREAAARLREPRLVPVAINPVSRSPLIYFADLGAHEYREWQHIITVQSLAGAGLIREYFSAPAELLDVVGLVPEPRRPRGFILHTSRCGSTVLCKSLARAEGAAVLSQPAALQHGFWAWIAGGWRSRRNWRPDSDARNVRRFQNLLGLLCRPRLAAEREIFIKFISWNSLYLNFIQAVFPGVPTLFMYRHPVEVIASVMRETSATRLARGTGLAEFLSGKTARQLSAMDDVDYLSMCYVRNCAAIMQAPAQPSMLAFSKFAPDTLEQVLAEAYALYPDQRQLERMREPFAVYSKDDRNTVKYKDDSLLKRRMLSDDETRRVQQACQASWQALQNSARNVI